MTEDHRLQRARELFVTYDGSPFYMSRDGVGHDYLRFAVPQEVEKAWREELTAAKLQGQGEPGNWESVYLLRHHNDTCHLHAVLHAEPLGDTFWQRCAYLETLLDYTKLCRDSYPSNDIRGAVQSVLKQARCLATSAPDQQLCARVDLLTQSAAALQSTLQ